MIFLRMHAVLRMLFISCAFTSFAAAQTTVPTPGVLWFSSEPIPPAYQTSDATWVQRFQQLDNSTTLADRQVKQALLLSRYATQEAILDGKLAYSHPAQTYLNEIKNHLLRKQPALRDSIRVHFDMNPEPGAYMSISGDLRFTAGMFSRCISEAQVAGIIAHEIIHYSEKHSEKSIRNPFGTNDSDNVRMASFNTRYSQSRELEADTKALNSFLKESGYKLDDVLLLYDLLAYSYLPQSEIPFPFENLVPACMEQHAANYIESPRPITPKEKLDDSRSTHPNAYRRQKAFAQKLQEIGYIPGSGNAYLLRSREQFHELQNEVREQEIFLNSVHHNYLNVLYEEMIQHPSEHTLLGMHALWALTTLRMDNNFDKEIGLHSDFEGEISTLHWFLTTIPKKDLILLAYRRAIETEQAFPNSDLARRTVDNLAGQSKRQFGLNNLPWDHAALCGITDTATWGKRFRDGIVVSKERKYFQTTARVVERKEAADRTIKPNTTTLLPISIYFHASGVPLMEEMAKGRERFESDVLVDLEDQPHGTYLPFEVSRITAAPAIRNSVLALDWWFDDMAYMTNWNSTVSIFTDEAIAWNNILKTKRISRINYGTPLFTGFLVTFDTDTQRAVDAVRWTAPSANSGAAKLSKLWLQSVGKPEE